MVIVIKCSTLFVVFCDELSCLLRFAFLTQLLSSFTGSYMHLRSVSVAICFGIDVTRSLVVIHSSRLHQVTKTP